MKKLLKIGSLLLVLIFMFAATGCFSSAKKYTYTHENGNISTFNLDFDKLTGVYEGYPIDVVLRNSMSYKKVSGATQKVTGTLTRDADGYEGWYIFETNHWSISIIVDDDSSIRCRINATSYTFIA